MSAPEPPETTRSERDPRRTWFVGGALLLVSAILGPVLRTAGPAGSILFLVPTLVFAAALLVYAWGPGSVTARRPLGTTALTVLGIWTAATAIFWTALATIAVPLLIAADSSLQLAQGVGILDTVVRLAAAIIAVVQIARAGVVPRPWQRAPLWTLAAVVATQVVTQGIAVLLVADAADAAFQIVTLGGIVGVLAPAFLGVLSIVLATRWHPPATVPVYPAPAED